MKYFILAGEKSGDLHAGNLAKAILDRDPQAEMHGWGGEHMVANQVKITQHYRDLEIMGFVGVLKALPKYLRLFKLCKDQIKALKPDAVILIDFGGFNLRLAKRIKSLNIKIFYYIPPKVWAWNTGRVRKIIDRIDHTMVILPFEEAFYAKHGHKVKFVGNPIYDAVKSFEPDPDFRQKEKLDQKPIVAILPGSRKGEITNVLDTTLKLAAKHPEYNWVVAGIKELPGDFYEGVSNSSASIVYNKTYDLLSKAHMAIVTSGTATLETGLFSVPQVVVYKTSRLNYWIAKSVIQTRFIALVNLIFDFEMAKELIQDDFNLAELSIEIRQLAKGPKRQLQFKNYEKLQDIMAGKSPSIEAAKYILKKISEK